VFQLTGEITVPFVKAQCIIYQDAETGYDAVPIISFKNYPEKDISIIAENTYIETSKTIGLNAAGNISLTSQTGSIDFHGPVTVNGTLLEDMIGTGGSFQYITEPVSPSGVLEIGKMSVGQIDIAGGMYVNIESRNNIKLSTSDDNYDNYIALNTDITLRSIHSKISVGSGKVVIAGDDEIILNSMDGRITCDSPISAPVYTAPVYTENDNGSYTKTDKTVELRVVERDGAYTIVID
jgi:hypothetical protein